MQSAPNRRRRTIRDCSTCSWRTASSPRPSSRPCRSRPAQLKRTEHEARASLKDGIKLKSQDGAFQAQIGAYAQLDSAFYSDGPTDFSDATQLRRTRLAVYGTVYQDWDYKVEADFAGTTQGGSFNDVTITDAYLRYTGFKPFSFTAGNFKVPFSLEAVSSAKYITFMERGLPFAFLNLRALGGMVAANGDNWTASAGAFGDTVTSENDDDEGKSVAARIAYAPFFQSDRVLHFVATWKQLYNACDRILRSARGGVLDCHRCVVSGSHTVKILS
ncbi:MAG: OprO/OprP family phosphate-selective porin [Actinomycetota bacterium]